MPQLHIPRPAKGNALYKGALIGVIIGMLLTAVCMNLFNRGASPDVETRNTIASAEQRELQSALACFDTVGYPNADLLGDIMPTLEVHLHAASALDEILVESCGAEYGLIDPEVYRYVQLSMSEILSAAEQGMSTDLGVENLRVYMLILKNNLAVRFDAEGAVLPLAK